MPEQNGPHWSLSDDHQTMIIRFPTEGGAVELRYSAAQVDETIRGLGQLRSHMKPAHANDPPGTKTIEAVPNPRWFAFDEPMNGWSTFRLLHPGFGWLNYAFPPHEAKAIADLFSRQAAAAPEKNLGAKN
jgi:hypothetical protein